MNLDITLDIPAGLEKLGANIVFQAWRRDSSTIAIQLEDFLRYRTYTRAYDTGALASDITSHKLPGTNAGPFLEVGFGDSNQLASSSHRYYAPYNEGPDLGLPTYTFGPRHLIADADPDDLPHISEWATATAKRAFAEAGVM